MMKVQIDNAYLREPWSVATTVQTRKMESFATIVNGFQLLTAFAKLSILDVCESPGYASEDKVLFCPISGVVSWIQT